MNDVFQIKLGDQLVLIKNNHSTAAQPIYLLLHGWTGDEHSMWIFASRLPDNALLVVPRGIFISNIGGYSWTSEVGIRRPQADEFMPALGFLNQLLTSDYLQGGDFSRLNLIGFSQGAALAYTYLMTHPDRVYSVAGLSGFLPDDADRLVKPGLLAGKPVFVAHGARDELVPVAMARRAVDSLEQSGARVIYCEDDVGHKLSASCFRGMQAFFAGQKDC
jgi:phospholipase/carboxylesterase